MSQITAEDYIANQFFIELFTECEQVILSFLVKLFNSIFGCGFFPEIWSKGCIVRVYKKGDREESNTYQVISFLSCIHVSLEYYLVVFWVS